MALEVGLDLKLYRNTGTYGTPVWNEVTIAQDLNFKVTKERLEATLRGAAWTTNAAGALKAELPLTILCDQTIDDYDVLRDAAVTRATTLDIAMANGAIATTGTRYMRMISAVFDWDKGEPVNGISTVSCTLAPAYNTSQAAPAYTTVP